MGGLQVFLRPPASAEASARQGVFEVRAWTIHKGMKAPQAAGVIHTDFEKHFIKADVINWQEFVDLGGWTKAREVGKVRLEGRDYAMKEGDVGGFKEGVLGSPGISLLRILSSSLSLTTRSA